MHWRAQRRQGSASVDCGKGVGDVLLFLNAFYLAWLAGRSWRARPMPETLRRLCRRWLPVPAHAGLHDVRCAAYRASRYIGRFGGLDSCVTRSLVMASLLRERGEVSIAIGFTHEGGAGGVPSGHAWVCLNGTNVSDLNAQSVSADFVETHQLQVS
jgi:hypothetical protein